MDKSFKGHMCHLLKKANTVKNDEQTVKLTDGKTDDGEMIPTVSLLMQATCTWAHTHAHTQNTYANVSCNDH